MSGLSVALLLSISGPIFAEERPVVTLSSTYDFDEDGSSEFLTVEKATAGARYPSSAAYYEIDETGLHVELWRFTSVSPILGAEIIDADGDGSPEIVVATQPEPGRPEAADRPWLHLFQWTGIDFSPTATLQWSGPDDGKHYRLSNITVIDMDNDDRDEIALALGSPEREVVLLRLDTSLEVPTFGAAQLLTAPTISSGYGQIFVSVVDHNNDGYLDLMAINREHTSLKVQIFENAGGDFVEGPSYQRDIEDLPIGLSSPIASGITTLDIDQDGTGEVFFPFRSGAAIALKLQDGQMDVLPLDEQTASLFTFAEVGLPETAINEILLERAERGIVAMKARKLKLEAIGTTGGMAPEEEMEITPPTSRGRRVQRVELTPVEKEEKSAESTREVAAAEQAIPEETVALPDTQMLRSPGKKVRRVELTSLERGQEEQVEETEKEAVALAATPTEPIPQEASSEVEEQESPEITLKTPGKVKKLELTSVTKEEVGEAEMEAIEIPPNVVISDTVFVGQLFSYPLEKENKALHTFKPLALPPGALFDPQIRAVTWTPDGSHVGVHKLAYEVEYEIVGERPAIEEVEGTTVQVLAKTERDTVEFYILVQQPKE